MRTSADILASARGTLTALSGNEAEVVLVAGEGFPRLWLGYQNDGTPAAYFETESGAELNYSVSQVISVASRLVDESSQGGPSVQTVKVACHDRRLDRVFCSFIDEVRARIGGGDDAVEVIRSSAGEWRSLLQVAVNPLTESAAVGIYGELRLLEAAIAELGPSAVDMWQRSPHETHDFIGPNARVEVKTSAFQDRSAVTVHGLRQLEPPVSGTLTLAVAEVQKHGRDTIDLVVGRLLDRGADNEVLTAKLRDAGYVAGMPGAEDFSFDLRSWRFWEITVDSAVLNRSAVHEAIADAVSSLSYSLNLSGLGEASESFDFERLRGGGEGLP